MSSPVHLVEQTPSSTMARRQGHGSYGPQLRDRKRGAVQEAKWLACRLCHFTNISRIELGCGVQSRIARVICSGMLIHANGEK